jgi:hypothetical protein
MFVLTLQIYCYSKQEELLKLKQRFCKIFLNSVSPFENNNSPEGKLTKTDSEEDNKFWENKSLIFGAGQSLIVILFCMSFSIPLAIVRSISRSDLNAINAGNGRTWVYISKITFPTSYQFLFPLFVIVGNAKMITSLKRDFKESSLWIKLTSIGNKFRIWNRS